MDSIYWSIVSGKELPHHPTFGYHALEKACGGSVI